MKIGVIGAGKLAQAIMRGWIDKKTLKKTDLWAITKSKASSNRVKKSLGIASSTLIDPLQLKKSSAVLLAAKPKHLEELCESLLDAGLTESTPVFSVLAGVSTKKISQALGRKNPVVITMTNTPCFVQEGMTTLFKGRHAKESHLKLAEKLFGAIGECQRLPESKFHEATALSASGPAFVYKFMESMILSAKELGLNEKEAQKLCAQTFLGAAKMLREKNKKASQLIKEVRTPGGCTNEGLLVMEHSNLLRLSYKTLEKTRNKSKTLAT